MSDAVIPMRAAAVRAIVRERDALNPDDPKHRELDQRAYQELFFWAYEIDLRGLEVWWGNGEYCDGRVLRVRDDPWRGRVLLCHEPHPEDGYDPRDGAELWEVLAAGWFQWPGDTGDPGSDGFLATVRALERQERRRAAS